MVSTPSRRQTDNFSKFQESFARVPSSCVISFPWGLGHSGAVTPDAIVLFCFAAACVTVGRSLHPQAKAIGLGLFLFRAVYLGISCTTGLAFYSICLAAVGCVLNVIEEASPGSADMSFSVYDCVHICWFANFVLMLVVGEAWRPVS